MPKPSPARVYRGTPRNLAFLAGRLRAGELVGVPTETVYGLAANALDAQACRKIFVAKGRPATDPLIVHVQRWEQLELLAQSNAAALKLARKFWPGPLTIVLPKKALVPDVVTAGKSSVALRMPAHRLFQRLLKRAGVPLAAPSANPFGYISPTTAEHVARSLGNRICYILDGGPSRIGLESTIVDLRNPTRPRLLRPGAITVAQLERVLGVRVPSSRRAPRGKRSEQAQLAPGMLAKHYSPRTPVVLHEQIEGAMTAREAYVFFRKPLARSRAGRAARNVFWLDEQGDLRGVARRLFGTLRRLDGLGFQRIHVELAPGGGLAHAINDRLRRAAAK